MRNLIALTLGFLPLLWLTSMAEEARNLEQAKAMSGATGKPILMKFFKEG